MESIHLSVTGMKCGGCVSTVEKILNNSDGIENDSVNLLTESAYFEITQKHVEIESVLENLKGNSFAGHLVKVADNFSYLDPVDNSISENQGLRLVLDDNSRVIVRLSGTGTKGATLRLYFEKFFNPQQNLSLNPQFALKPLINDLDALLNISKLTKMETPTVIT